MICMDKLFEKRVRLLSSNTHLAILRSGKRGIEREALRATRTGTLALSSHPAFLGSSLTHPSITTDFSESMLELVTTACRDSVEVLNQLDDIHRYIYEGIGNEELWNQSMPCLLPPDGAIPIAYYGVSNAGKLKHQYRQGLALRYGRSMQCIAGIHYNFSLNSEIWPILMSLTDSAASLKDFETAAYMGMIRNFDRHRWLLAYLFGASPACAGDFMEGRSHSIPYLSSSTLYLPYGTSLRMSKMGYQNDAQTGLVRSYNSLADYLADIGAALSTSYSPYEEIDRQNKGPLRQLNTHKLQIENEHYAMIRPKRIISQGRSLTEELRQYGIQYVELRCIDIDPFSPVGVSLDCMRFLDIFAHYCILTESAFSDETEMKHNAHNFNLAVTEGRRPGLTLVTSSGERCLRLLGLEVIDQMTSIADLLDSGLERPVYASALSAQKEKLLNAELTPSAMVLDGIRGECNSFVGFSQSISEEHANFFRNRPLSENRRRQFELLSEVSSDYQREIEFAEIDKSGLCFN